MIRDVLSFFAEKVVLKVASLIPQSRKRVIWDRAGGTPYLSRFYLSGAPRMADGSSPFNPDGSPKENVLWSEGLGVYLHKFHKSDDDGALHNHPWKWALSFVLVNGYSEERRIGVDGRFKVIRRSVLPFSFNYITSDDFHRVDLIRKDAWSIFITGPKFQGWGFWDRDTNEFVPWREFIARRRKEEEEWHAS